LRAAPYHFRAATGQEVDIVLEAADGRVAGIEVKASASVSAKDFAGLELLSVTCGAKLARGVVLYRGASRAFRQLSRHADQCVVAYLTRQHSRESASDMTDAGGHRPRHSAAARAPAEPHDVALVSWQAGAFVAGTTWRSPISRSS
jgi:hypothetical protein